MLGHNALRDLQDQRLCVAAWALVRCMEVSGVMRFTTEGGGVGGWRGRNHACVQ